MQKYYITTSIAYANAYPHIGFLLELLSADVLTRYHKSLGEDVYLQTGTDEHGIKVATVAKEANLSPKEYVDRVSDEFKKLQKDFNILDDGYYFIRTTDENHKKYVADAWNKLKEAGLLEKRKYSGWYCSGCEAFKTDREVVGGKCEIHEKKLEKIEEENYFLLISKFQKQILSWLKDKKPIEPVGRLNEMLSFVESGLEDVSASRHVSKLSWGVEVPGDSEQVMYVWVDALLNYLSGIEASGRKIADWWPADLQIVGKDILRFHATIWPAILLGLGFELPKKILVHGFINVDGKKMSKSIGNVVSPDDLLKKYGAEATRYLLFRQLNYLEDSDFVWKDVDAVYNGELANGIGNLVARVIGLLNRVEDKESVKNEVAAYLKDKPKLGDLALANYDFAKELLKVNELVKAADGWITQNKPWQNTVKSGFAKELLKASNLSEVIERLKPFTPVTCEEILKQLASLQSKPIFERLR